MAAVSGVGEGDMNERGTTERGTTERGTTERSAIERDATERGATERSATEQGELQNGHANLLHSESKLVQRKQQPSNDENGAVKDELLPREPCSTCTRATVEVRFMNQRAKPGHAYVPTQIEHLANIVTHALLIVPSLLGVFWMLHLAKSGSQSFSAVVFGGATFVLFCVSTTFHTISYCGCYSRSIKNFFHIGDRAVIYVFIAASYTPWLTLKEVATWGTVTLYIVWCMCVMGILYAYIFHEKYKWLEIVLYLTMGLCPSISILSMDDHSGIYEMGLGGAVYICGVIFFKLDGVIPFAHAIWHCFVFVGVVFHYTAVCKYLLGASTGVEKMASVSDGDRVVFLPGSNQHGVGA